MEANASDPKHKPREFDQEPEKDPSILKWKHDDNYLRKVEVSTVIPKRMREKAKESCTEYEKAYVDCCRDHKVLLFMKCQAENKAFNDCLIRQYEDPKLREQCTAEYLKERAQYRHTGVPAAKSKRAKKIEEFQKQQELKKQQLQPQAE